MHPIEDMGLVKIDLLAQMGLAVIFDTMSAAKTNYGVEIDWDRLDPVEDESTKELMRTGATMGCFYIESPGMRSLLRKLKVDDFETLVAVSSIIRPGVSDSGMTKAFIERHLGRQAVTYQHPEMERMLKRTYGVMIYQEDVIKVANAVAGMSLGEADSLRKCMSKKRDWERMDKYKARFIEGAALNGVPPDTALEIWRQVESFGGYAFCKAHSASFAILSWRCAYLKAHYPAEFMAAVIANRGGFYDTSAYIEEARRMGLAILPPDVNESCIETSGAMVGRGRL
jgi:DNA polymerase III alpha subunit